MPYLILTRNAAGDVIAQTAARTLDNMRATAVKAVEARLNAQTDPDAWRNSAWDAPTVAAWYFDENDVSEQLPDGSVVSTSRVEWLELATVLGGDWSARISPGQSLDELIGVYRALVDAYNAQCEPAAA